MTRGRIVIALVAITACGDAPPGPGPLHIAGAEPAYAPLVGGTLIRLHGTGFGGDTRVLIDGRESPLVRAIDTTTVELVVPPGAQPGEAEVVAFEDTGTSTARDIFRYSDGPVITSVSPDRIAGPTGGEVIVHGSGFLDEAAGEPTLILDGQAVMEVTVVDDTTLRFVAPAGQVFRRPDLELVNLRGRAQRASAFRYAPGDNGGLLMFTRWGTSFAMFYDPLTNARVAIPALPGGTRLRSVFRDELGDYWGVDIGNRLGRLDLETQTLVSPIAMNERVPATTLVDSALLGIRRSFPYAIGTIDRASGVFVAATTVSLQCCGSFAIAHDGTKLWFTQREANFQGVVLNTYDVATSTFGTPVTLTGGPAGFRVEEMRFYNGVLYAVGLSTLMRIDPSTGAVTQLTTPIAERFTALEPYE